MLSGAVVVVTGAARGIGAALAERFAAEGAQLVLADLDPRVLEVAEQVGGLALVGDVASEEVVEQLVSAARRELGEIDLFCANAGIIGPAGFPTDDAELLHTFEVNVMSHVRAARALLPAWLDRGRGHLLVTVSAAGLLSMPGAAAYTMTKHASLAFAEWLAYTYAHHGIKVQALCPRGVRTPMLGDDPYTQTLLAHDAVTPDQVADSVLSALDDDRFLVLPHADVYPAYVKRATDTDAWLAAMNRIEQRVQERLSAP